MAGVSCDRCNLSILLFTLCSLLFYHSVILSLSMFLTLFPSSSSSTSYCPLSLSHYLLLSSLSLSLNLSLSLSLSLSFSQSLSLSLSQSLSLSFSQSLSFSLSLSFQCESQSTHVGTSGQALSILRQKQRSLPRPPSRDTQSLRVNTSIIFLHINHFLINHL